MKNMTQTNERDSLVIWWERNCDQRRKEIAKNYPLPYDGAGFYVMNNFFAVVGFGDERLGTATQLSAAMYMAHPVITERFLELWPKIKPTVSVPDETTT
jgi:hypothetical protein